MEFCMNSKEESSHKSIRSALMGLFLQEAACTLPCVSSAFYPDPPPQRRGRVSRKHLESRPLPRLQRPYRCHSCCVSLVFPEADVRVEVKSRRGAEVAPVSPRGELSMWTGRTGAPREARRGRKKNQSTAALAGAAQRKCWQA